jgi:hypothetical protein
MRVKCMQNGRKSSRKVTWKGNTDVSREGGISFQEREEFGCSDWTPPYGLHFEGEQNKFNWGLGGVAILLFDRDRIIVRYLLNMFSTVLILSAIIALFSWMHSGDSRDSPNAPLPQRRGIAQPALRGRVWERGQSSRDLSGERFACWLSWKL